MMAPLIKPDLYSHFPRDFDRDKYQEANEETTQLKIERDRDHLVNQWYSPTSD